MCHLLHCIEELNFIWRKSTLLLSSQVLDCQVMDRKAAHWAFFYSGEIIICDSTEFDPFSDLNLADHVTR
jgi:hypothetical protein